MDYWVWLASIEGLGSVRKLRALQKFRNPENFYNAAKKEILSIEGFNEKICEKIETSKDIRNIDSIIEKNKKYDIRYINFFDEEYPEKLKSIYGMPITLFYKGDINLLNKKSIAIIGSRNASNYGLRNAYNIAKDGVSENYVVVSGLAKGIDTYAHEGALKNKGRTIGVLGCGLDIVYPKENINLYKEMMEKGLIISEYVVGTKPCPENFPMRNRIISGLADKIIVVEAAINSGTSITVNHALEQGKDVYAVPGNINSNMSVGTNKLIKEGAGIYTCIKDLRD